ncbi:MAG: PKD domain-containing protein, partial [Saprospiraceae bacterium]
EPFANFSANNNTGCAPLTVQFNNLSNSTDVVWTFEGGTPATSTNANPEVYYLNPGAYYVKLVASNSLGSDTLLLNDYVTVYAQPSGDFEYTINGNVVSFVQATSNVAGFSWDFGDGTNSTATNPTYIYENDGTYTVVFTYYNSCDTLTESVTITIATPPTPSFSNSALTGCSPLEVQFFNESSSNTNNITWTFEGGTPATSTEDNPIVIFNNPGTYDVSLTATNSVGTNTVTETNYITVLGPPDPDFYFTANELLYYFTYSGDQANTVIWNFGDGGTASGQTAQHEYAEAGEYNITIIAGNECGYDTLHYSLGVSLAPLAQFSYNINEGCAPLEVEFTNTSSATNTIFWIFEGGIPQFSTEDNPTVSYTVEGDYNVTLYAFGNSLSDTLVIEDVIHVNSGPEVDFEYSIDNNIVEFTNTSASDATDFYWDFGDNNLSQEENPVHTYTYNGTYVVTLYASNECGQHYFSQTIEISTVNNIDESFGTMVLYPNPNNGLFNIDFYSKEEGDYDIQLYNSTGILIQSNNSHLTSGQNTIPFNYIDIPSGLYLIRFIKDGKYQNLLFSKQ